MEAERVKAIDLRKIKKVLIIRLRFIGDVVISTILIEALKKQYPKLSVSYLGEPNSVEALRENPLLDEIIEVEKGSLLDDVRTIKKARRRKFDLVIDMFGNPRSALIAYASGAPIRIGWKQRGRKYAYNVYLEHKAKNPHQAEIYGDVARLLGLGEIKSRTKVYLSAEEKKFGAAFLKKKGVNMKKRLVGIHPGASWPAKTWMKENFVKLADRLMDEGNQVVLFGGPKDRAAAAEVYVLMRNKPVFVDNLFLRDFMSVLNCCTCFVTNDNGPMHLGVALGVPTLGIFGSSNPAVWFPYKGKDVSFLKKYPSCWPCGKDHCEDLKCLKAIKPEEAYKALQKICK